VYGVTAKCKCQTSGDIRKKLEDSVDWQEMYAPSCEACREIYAEKQEQPPCETCRPKFLSENEDALKIFFLTRLQMIVGVNGQPIDILHTAIHEAMNLYGVKDKISCFEKVIRLSQIWLKTLANKK
jgi:hypothetical protein